MLGRAHHRADVRLAGINQHAVHIEDRRVERESAQHQPWSSPDHARDVAPASAWRVSSGMSKIVSATGTPAACNASTLPCAVPVLPEMIAPAWPIRLPGGAVRPEMKPITGFVIDWA